MRSFEASPFVLPPRQERSRAALARIVDAAAQVMIRQGSEGFSMAEIAAAAGMPVGNIYRRFKGKEDIVQAIKLDATHRLESAIVERLDGQAFSDVRELVLAYAEAMSAAFEKDEALHRVLFSQPMVTPVISGIGTEGRLRIFEQYKRSLLPLLGSVPARRKEVLVRVSFQITALAFLAKAKADDPLMAATSWAAVAREYGEAAILYLSSSRG